MYHDEFYMARAFELARLGRFTTAPNPNVGCVIVRDGEIVGEGYHLRAGEPHAEVHALRMAGDKARGATAYVTLEPCSHHGRTPPCADALVAAGVTRVVAAMQDPNPQVAGRGLYKLQQAGVEVRHGLMLAEAEAVNLGFLKRMRTGFPYVQLKLGASLDGRTAMASGESQWITSPEARQDVQRLRAQSAAILSTSATVLADDPSLTVRWDELTPRRSASIRATIYASRCASCSTAKTALPRSTAWCSSPAPLGWRACRRMHRPGRKTLSSLSARRTAAASIWW